MDPGGGRDNLYPPHLEEHFHRLVQERLPPHMLDDAPWSEEDKARFSDVFNEAMRHSVKLVLANLMASMPQIGAERARLRTEFEARLYQRWQPALDLFDLTLWMAREAGSTFNQRYRPQAVRDQDLIFDVLTRLHARACMVGSEVLTLLHSGHAAGAHARWRTLHEVTVVAYLIRQHGADLAKRYVDHDAIEELRIAVEYDEHAAVLGFEPLDSKVIPNLRARRDQLITNYGKAFGSTFGWAAGVVCKGEPTFKDLEKAAGLERMRPYYRMASHGIHPNPKGITFNLGSRDHTSMLLSGPSSAGLADPGHGALASLVQCTVVLLNHGAAFEELLTMHVLDRLEQEATQAFAAIHQQLEREEERAQHDRDRAEESQSLPASEYTAELPAPSTGSKVPPVPE